MSQAQKLFERYNLQVPRYTSYPPITLWNEASGFESRIYQDIEASLANDSDRWTLYLHLPFCETLCTFCACNNVITKDHSVEDSYVDALLKEWQDYKLKAPKLLERSLQMVHLGGGSPTFFSVKNLRKILEQILTDCSIDEKNFEGAVEVDPRRCTKEQLELFYELGFRRLSIGVQDFDEKVQTYVNRKQSVALVANCVKLARDLGFESINFDLIYGLPGQSLESFEFTCRTVCHLQPDRLAVYGLAVVPWVRSAHNAFGRVPMLEGYEKRQLFERACEVFKEAGFIEFGIDHFAKKDDSMAKTFLGGNLNRNFMGYTEHIASMNLGLGVSSISETKSSFFQNPKDLNEYLRLWQVDVTKKDRFVRYYKMTERDNEIKALINSLMIYGKSPLPEGLDVSGLASFIEDKLVSLDANEIIIAAEGKPFTRSICAAIDPYVDLEANTKSYSASI